MTKPNLSYVPLDRLIEVRDMKNGTIKDDDEPYALKSGCLGSFVAVFNNYTLAEVETEIARRAN